MAAVAKGCNACKLLLAILLLFSLSFSVGLVAPCDLCKGTTMSLSETNGTINVTISAYDSSIAMSEDLAKLEQAYRLGEGGSEGQSQGVMGSADLFSVIKPFHGEDKPLENASIYFFYYNAQYDSQTQTTHYTEVPIQNGCYPAPKTGADGKTSCNVPDSLYIPAGKCIQVYASFCDPKQGGEHCSEYRPEEESIYVCAGKTNSLSVMGSSIKANLTDPQFIPFCFLSMVILGLMLASMFFTGRSPLSLLDLTTPLLPKPKSISYAGISLGVGLPRLRKEMGILVTKLNKSALETSPELLRLIRAGGTRPGAEALIRLIQDSKADAALKMLAYRAILAGKDRAFIKRLLSVTREDGSVNWEEAGKVFSEMEKERRADLNTRANKGLEDRVFGISKMYFGNKQQQQAFGAATGSVYPWLSGPIGKTFGRLPWAGEFFRGGLSSAFFGARRVGGMYSSLLKGTVRGVGKQAEALDKAVTGGKISPAVKQVALATGVAGWAAIKGAELEVARLFNLFDMGDANYKRMLAEARKDVINWLIWQAIKDCGGNITLTQEQVMNIGKRPLKPDDVTEMLGPGFNTARFSALEGRIRTILGNSAFNDTQRALALMDVLRTEGIAFDRMGAMRGLGMLNRIERELPRLAEPGDSEAIINSLKYERLMLYLQENKRMGRINETLDLDATFGNNFYFTVGRTNLSYEERGVVLSDHNFRTYFMNNYREMLENARPVAAGQRQVSILDAAYATFARIAAENWGVMDSKVATGEAKIVMQNIENWLRALINPDAFKEFYKKDASKATAEDLIKVLYSPATRGGKENREAKILAPQQLGLEHGPLEGMWRVNMRAHWRILENQLGGALNSVQHQTEGEVYRANITPAAIQKIIDQSVIDKANGRRTNTISEEDARKQYFDTVATRNLFERLKGIMELGRENTYFTSWGEYDRFRNTLNSFREWMADKEFARTGTRPDSLSIRNQQISEAIKKPLSLEDISKGTWLKLKEGAFVPFYQQHTFALAQGDRMVNTRIYCKEDGVWSQFAPERLMRKKELILEQGDVNRADMATLRTYSALIAELENAATGKPFSRTEMQRLVDELGRSMIHGNQKYMGAYAAMLNRIDTEKNGEYRNVLSRQGITIVPQSRSLSLMNAFDLEVKLSTYLSAQTTAQRRAAAKELKEWAALGTASENRQLKLGLLFHNAGARTGDFADFNFYSEAIRMAPTGQTPEEGAGLKKWAKGLWRDSTLGLEQMLFSTFGQHFKAQYEGSLTSEYFRETGAIFAGKLVAGEFGDVNARGSRAMKAYNELVDSFSRYHSIWDDVITRDPRGNSSAIGSGFILSSYFHHGPALNYGPIAYRRLTYAGYKKPWYSLAGMNEAAKAVQWAPQMFNWMVGTPFILAYRTYVTSRWGYPTKFDRKYVTTELAHRAAEAYTAELKDYSDLVRNRATELTAAGLAARDAENQARAEYNAILKSPQFHPQRDILNPYEMTESRRFDARRSMTNPFYAAFDGVGTSVSKLAARVLSSPMFPLAYIPSRWVQDKFLSNSYKDNPTTDYPKYVSTSGIRSALISMTGPLQKRHYGGTELTMGIHRGPEDAWAYQSGVNAIWGNANPGISYIDYSNAVHLDPRAANFLRYESRFKPFLEHDEYVKKQSQLGLTRREIDPTQLLLDRNAELRGYGWRDNTLYRFLAPGTFLFYKGKGIKDRVVKTYGSISELYHQAQVNDATYRGGSSVLPGVRHLGWKAGYHAADAIYDKFVTGYHTDIRHCSACGGPMAAGGACPACNSKRRCEHCNSLVSPFQNHTCVGGVSRNLQNEDLRGGFFRKPTWGREA